MGNLLAPESGCKPCQLPLFDHILWPSGERSWRTTERTGNSSRGWHNEIMNTEDVPSFLSKRVPALSSVINEAMEHLKTRYGADTPLSDHILSVVLAPLVSRMLRSNDQNDRSTLRSLFAALDELLDDPNPNMTDVVFVSFLEQLAQDRQDWELARAYMGERLVRNLETGEDVLPRKKSQEIEAAELILAFVRGERSWKVLEKAGVYI